MDDAADALALGARRALPDALRALVESYPPEGWRAHPQFTALIEFWLERHLMFRQLQGALLDDTRAFLGGARDPAGYARGLSRNAGLFLNELHGHHRIEDLHYFPALKGLDPRLAAGLDLLDADHHALDPLLAGLADRANAVLRDLGSGGRGADPAGRLAVELERFAGLLDRHLTDEEEIVVPILLAHPGALGA